MPPQGPVGDAKDAKDAKHTDSERRYPLSLSGGGFRIGWRLPGKGLTLRGSHLAWTADGVDHEYALDDIRSIRLQQAAVGRSAIGFCQISFRDGRLLNVFGSNDRGTGDADQATHYAAFVRDLHRRIPGQALRQIAFNAGLSDTRYRIVSVATVALGLMLVGGPLVMLFIVSSKDTLQVLGVLAAGTLFCWPLWRVWDNNRPREYAPHDLPENLLG